MIKSISQWAFAPDRPLEQVFSMARQHGFEAVEVAIAEQGELTPQTNADDCRRIVERAKQSGVQLASLASGLGWKYHLTTSDEAARQKAIEVTASSLEVAQRLGVDAILCVPGGVGFLSGERGVNYEAAYNNALKSLQQLAPIAEKCGVSVGVENVWNKFLLSPLEMRRFLDEAGSPRVMSYFDVGNVLFSGYPEEWIEILGHRIARIHFKDFKTKVGTIDGFCDLLEGDVDFGAVMQALRNIGYDGFITSEFFDCEADLPKISAAMDKIFAM